jgi:hypothetical protein
MGVTPIQKNLPNKRAPTVTEEEYGDSRAILYDDIGEVAHRLNGGRQAAGAKLSQLGVVALPLLETRGAVTAVFISPDFIAGFHERINE